MNTVGEIDGLKVEMNTVVKNLSDVVKGTDKHLIKPAGSTMRLFSYLNNTGN